MEATFNTASRFLRRLAVPPYFEAHNRLAGLVRTVHILDAFRQYFPDKTPDTSGLGLADLDADRLLGLQQEAITAVGQSFPVLDEHMEMLVQEGEPLCIYPDSCGFAWDDEWLNEIFQDPSQLTPDSDLAMFFKTLWIATTQFGAEDGQPLWEAMQGYFGYPCGLPQANIHARDFNRELLANLLESEGLGDFRRAIDVALCDTGNLFLDTCPEEYGYGMVAIPEFTANNIRELQRLWVEARNWLADYEQCREQVLANPGIYTRIAEMWELACDSQSPPTKQLTLLEVFGEDHDDSHPPLA